MVFDSCQKASKLMMKHLDSALTLSEEDWLTKHIDTCEQCKEDFSTYNIMTEEFAEIERTRSVLKTPDCFSSAVMSKITVLPVQARKTFNNFIFILWTVFSLLLGTGVLLVINKNRIIEALGSNATLASFLQEADDFIFALKSTAVGFSNSCAAFFYDYRYVIFGISAFLIVAQYLFRFRKHREQ